MDENIKTVLIAEQDSIVHTFLHFIFEQMNFCIIDVFYENPYEVYLKNKSSISFIIADMNLEEMDGVEFYDLIRHDNSDVFFLLISTGYEEEFQMLTSDNNACYLLKPFSLYTLQSIVKDNVTSINK